MKIYDVRSNEEGSSRERIKRDEIDRIMDGSWTYRDII